MKSTKWISVLVLACCSALAETPGWVDVSTDSKHPSWKYADASGEYVGDAWLSFADDKVWVAYVGNKPCRSGQFATLEAAKKCVMNAMVVAQKRVDPLDWTKADQRQLEKSYPHSYTPAPPNWVMSHWYECPIRPKRDDGLQRRSY